MQAAGRAPGPIVLTLASRTVPWALHWWTQSPSRETTSPMWGTVASFLGGTWSSWECSSQCSSFSGFSSISRENRSEMITWEWALGWLAQEPFHLCLPTTPSIPREDPSLPGTVSAREWATWGAKSAAAVLSVQSHTAHLPRGRASAGVGCGFRPCQNILPCHLRPDLPLTHPVFLRSQNNEPWSYLQSGLGVHYWG